MNEQINYEWAGEQTEREWPERWLGGSVYRFSSWFTAIFPCLPPVTKRYAVSAVQGVFVLEVTEN